MLSRYHRVQESPVQFPQMSCWLSTGFEVVDFSFQNVVGIISLSLGWVWLRRIRGTSCWRANGNSTKLTWQNWTPPNYPSSRVSYFTQLSRPSPWVISTTLAPHFQSFSKKVSLPSKYTHNSDRLFLPPILSWYKSPVLSLALLQSANWLLASNLSCSFQSHPIHFCPALPHAILSYFVPPPYPIYR